MTGALRGVHVLVAGAGLAGLSAARLLESFGALVTVVDARERVGGRVWTIRRGFRERQHAEAGADLIDSDQHAVVNLARELGLQLVPILKTGFGYCGHDRRGRVCIQSVERGFSALGPEFTNLIDQYKLSEQRWDSAIAQTLGATSVAAWLKSIAADEWLISRFRGLRGLFLADPEDLSLLALIDFFAAGAFGSGEMLRIKDGNDRLATETAKRLQQPVHLRTAVRRIDNGGRKVVVSVEEGSGLHTIEADYFVAAIPTTTLRMVQWAKPLPEMQQMAIGRLRYGPASRLLLQFDRRFWRKAGRPNAFGTDQSIGAVWDANEQQSGRPGILMFLAGGRASEELQTILRSEELSGVAGRLSWLGTPANLIASHFVVWEDEIWSRGGYAYFDPSFNPLWRDWLARPAGRVVFAGEHTSIRWQGYMNGAVESGQRAAYEVLAMVNRQRD